MPPRFDLDSFILLRPKRPRTVALSLNLYPNDTIRFNARLHASLRDDGCAYIQVRTSADGRQLLLHPAGETDEASHPLQKSDPSLHLVDLADVMKQCGRALPAHYTSEYIAQENCWLCTWDASFVFPQQKITQKRAQRPRRSGFKGMMPDAGWSRRTAMPSPA